MVPIARFPIVIAIDDSEYAEIVLEHALDQATRHDAPDLHVVSIVDDDRELDAVQDRVARFVAEGLDVFGRDHSEWRTRIHIRRGVPEDEIANLTAEVGARLLVIGRFGVHRRLRSVADRVIENAACPTLVVGLTGRAVDEHPQCPACVAVRAESDGEKWFCLEHASPDRMRLSSLVPRTTMAHGGLW